MTKIKHLKFGTRAATMSLAAVLSCTGISGVYAGTSADGTLEWSGFMENATFLRKDVGLAKFRNTV